MALGRTKTLFRGIIAAERTPTIPGKTPHFVVIYIGTLGKFSIAVVIFLSDGISRTIFYTKKIKKNYSIPLTITAHPAGYILSRASVSTR